MSKEGGKLPPAGCLDILTLNVSLIAEGGELGGSAQEVVVAVGIVSDGEAFAPFVFAKDSIDNLHIGTFEVDLINWAIHSERSCETVLDKRVIRVRNTVAYTNLLLVVIPVAICPEAIFNNGSAGLEG